MDNTEVDFMEGMSGNGAYDFGLHHWHPDGSDTPTSTVGSPVKVAADFSKPHTYGFLSVPAQGNAPGYAKWFFDGRQVGNTVTFGQSGLYSTLNTQPMKVMVGTGPNNPMTVYSVSVWQSGSADSGQLPGLPAGPCLPPTLQQTQGKAAMAYQ